MDLLTIVALAQAAFGHVAEPQQPATLLVAQPAGAILRAGDLGGDPAIIAAMEGKATRRYLPAGAAVRESDLRAPVLVSRNALVRLQFIKGALSISTEGRALSDGALGEDVRVMSANSKTMIVGVVAGAGLVQVR